MNDFESLAPSQKRKIPHVRQSDSKRNCGAACFCMLLQFYKMKGKLAEITAAVSKVIPNFGPSCRNNLIVKHANSLGIPCCAVSAIDMRALVVKCFENGIDLMISYRPDITQAAGHFCVVVGYDDEFIYLNNPQIDAPDGIGIPVEFSTLSQLARKDQTSTAPEIVVDNTAILFANPKKSFKSHYIRQKFRGEVHDILIFDAVENEVSAILMPNVGDGCWVYATPLD